MKKLWHKKVLWFSLLSFLLPLITLFYIYYINNIYFGSTTTLLAGDAYHQYVVFHTAISNILHGKGSLFYNWNIGLGVNFYTLSAYYLGSFFTPIAYFFNAKNMPDALYFLTLLKFGAIGLSAFTSFRHIFKKAALPITFALSMSFTLMSFTASFSELITWLDVFIYLPFVLWGLTRLMNEKKCGLLFVSLLLLLISNYYFSFMVCIFITLYYLANLFSNFKTYRQTIPLFIKTTVLAGIASFIVLLPVYIDLRTVGEKLTTISRLKTESTGPFDLIYKNFIGAYDTTQYQAIPMIYVGLIPLFLAVLYFFNRKFSRRQRLASGLLILVLIASFYLEPLNLAWQGMHSPNMFLFRFSFLFSTLIILLAGYNIEELDEKLAKKLCITLLGFILLAGISFIDHGHYQFITSINYVLTGAFLLSYLILSGSFAKKLISRRFFIVLLMILMPIEAAVNTMFIVSGIRKEWVYPTRASYQQIVNSVLPLAKKINKEQTFVRTENLEPIVSNDGMTFNLNTISQFSSVRNTRSSGAMNTLGYLSTGTNLNLHYPNNTILADSLFGVKYLLSKNDLSRFGYVKDGESGNYTLYKNNLAAPLGILTASKEDTKQLGASQLDSQRTLTNYLANEDSSYYSVNYLPRPDFKNSTLETKIDSTKWTLKQDSSGQTIIMNFTTTVPAHRQAYYMVEADTDNNAPNTVQVTVNGHTTSKRYNQVGKYYDLGYYNQETTITFSVSFSGRKEVTLFPPKIALLNTDAYQAAMQKIQTNGVNFKIAGNKATSRYKVSKDETLFLSIPYNAGWSAKIDGKTVATRPIFKGFLGVNVPKGNHKIELTFIPQGFKVGVICFVSAILLFVLSEWLRGFRRSKIQ
ncbi:MAG: YfhO family protein [Streptococcaceae bacterium]|jgi:uncharacterized membrane protein YfhO|nr:YfhO family protein [Streptococcaceae bacterium]